MSTTHLTPNRPVHPAGTPVTLYDGRVVFVSTTDPAALEEVDQLSESARLVSAQRSLLCAATPLDDSADGHSRSCERLAVRDSAGTLIGLGAYAAIDDEEAEACCAVHPDYQEHGLGTRLLRRLAERARVDGLRQFVFDLPLRNRHLAMEFLLDSGLPSRWDVGGEQLRVELDLERRTASWSTPDCTTDPPA